MNAKKSMEKVNLKYSTTNFDIATLFFEQKKNKRNHNLIFFYVVFFLLFIRCTQFIQHKQLYKKMLTKVHKK